MAGPKAMTYKDWIILVWVLFIPVGIIICTVGVIIKGIINGR